MRWLKHPYPFAIALGIISILSTCQASKWRQEAAIEQPAIIRAGLRVGVLLPRTGPYAVTGQPLIQVFPLLMRKANACGGVNAAPVTFVIKDDRAEPALASRSMVELALVDDVHAIVGGVTSSVALELVSTTERFRLPIISPASTSVEITQQVQDQGLSTYWTRTVPSDGEEARALATLALQQKIQSVALVAVNDSYGETFTRVFSAAFQETGGAIVNADSVISIDLRSPDTLDLTVSERLGDAEAVLIVAYPEAGGRWLYEALEQEVLGDRQLLLTSSVYTPRFLDEIGVTGDQKARIAGAIGLTPGANGNGYVPFKTLWESKEGYAPPRFAAQTWDAGALVILAAEAAGRNSKQGIKDQIQRVANPPGIEVTDLCRGLELLRRGEDINYQGASGTVDIDSLGNVVGPYDVWTVDERGWFDVLYQLKP